MVFVGVFVRIYFELGLIYCFVRTCLIWRPWELYLGVVDVEEIKVVGG